MKRSSTTLLQIFVVLIGIGALAFLLWEPHLEGRNKHATLFEVYFKDPFLAFAYVASLPGFAILYQAFKLLGYAGQNRLLTPEAVKSLRTIKYCAWAILGFVVASLIFLFHGDPEDRPPGVVMRAVVAFGSIVIATAATMLERMLHSAVDLKSENGSTV